MSESSSDSSYSSNFNYQTKFSFQKVWKKTKSLFGKVGNFLSKNKNKIGFGFGIFVMAGAVTASVFFGPALYTAITGLLPAVIPGLVAITTGLAAAVPPIGLAFM